MKHLIEKVLEEYADAEVNLKSSAARKMVASGITAVLKTRDDLGVDEYPYPSDFGDTEREIEKAKWVYEDAGDGHMLKTDPIDYAISSSQDKLSEQIVDENKSWGYIFESPDGGKTVYKRKVGESKRELVSKKFWNEYTRNRNI
jgi:hypothetical protein